MMGQEVSEQELEYEDRKSGLMILGIFQIMIGVFIGLGVPMMVLVMVLATVVEEMAEAAVNPGMIIVSIVFYSLGATWFIWLGIGSIKARRWARALWLVSSWIWLVGGLFGMVWVLLVMPNMYEQMVRDGLMPSMMARIMRYGMLGLMSFIYVVMPGVQVWFYGKRDVKLTCEHRDPQVRWTDKCPLPVLALAFLYGVSAFSLLSMGFYDWVFPFFGVVLSGYAGAGVVAALMLVMVWLAWGNYKLDIRAWWGSVILTVGWSLSYGITFLQIDMWEMYEKMNFPEEQLELMKQYNMPQGSTMFIMGGCMALVGLGYLWYAKRFYPTPGETGNVGLDGIEG